MIGLVLVSHSAKLAEGVRELLEQMTQGRVPIAVAGGIDDATNPIGTDPMQVLAAIEAIYSPDGVIVLMDLGSALLSAETALDLLAPAQRAHVYLSDAPFVEGAVAAAVQASIGSPAAAILAEARASLHAKAQHLGAAAAPGLASETPAAALPDALHLRLTIPNRLGLHARPAARLARLAGAHQARLTLRKQGAGEATAADGRSINQIAWLDARHGDVLDVYAAGTDAEALLAAVAALANANFGDVDGAAESVALPPVTATAPAADVLQGIAASGGVVAGSIHLLHEQTPWVSITTSEDAEREQARLSEALETAAAELTALTRRAKSHVNSPDEADIFAAHLLMLQDDALRETALRRLREERLSAAAGWWTAIESAAERYRTSDNAYLRARAADVLDVGRRVLRLLDPQADGSRLTLHVPCILAAPDLLPSETAQLDPALVLGIITRQGSATAHSAIIARSLGIPAVVGLGSAFDQLAHGQTVMLDGERGEILLKPTPEQVARAAAAAESARERRDALLSARHAQALTLDGRRIEVAGNIGVPGDAERLAALGAEGVGLFRTEFLFMSRTHAPDEDEQVAAYTAAARALPGLPIIIRTLDIGGDKPVAYLDSGHEDNPFLGYRGIRNWLGDERLARTQLRAVCRTAADHPVRLMFPMVGTLDEVEQARALLDAVQAELAAARMRHSAPHQVGIMIEVPSAVLAAAQLAPHVDFFSIGTNDLAQYLMAADRGNARVSHLASPFQPALLQAIHQVVTAAHAHGKWVGICGEMGGNPLLTTLLIGLGIDELSMSAPSVPEIKALVRETRYSEAQALARAVLALTTAAEVERVLRAESRRADAAPLREADRLAPP